MQALGLSLSVFLYLCFVGRAFLSLIRYRGGVLRAWLLAPAFGLSLLLLGLMIFNQAGLPIRDFAWPWTLTLGVGACLVWWKHRPGLGGKAMLPFGAACLLFLVLAGWPATLFGFKWVSYANDDMANYCLAAERFADFGFFRTPSELEINLRDHTQSYWYMHAADLMRFGSEHVLSWLLSLTGKKATEIFMPCIISLGMIQLFAAGVLVLHKGRFRLWSQLTILLLALCPLFLLGALYQLIAQVGGMALMMATFALLTEKVWTSPKRRLAKQGVIIGLPAAVLCIYYPEVVPFVVLSYLGFLAMTTLRERQLPQDHLRRAVYALLAVMVFLNHNLISFLYTLANQAGVVAAQVDLSLSLFPFFLLPTGTANLFGLMPIAKDFAEPVASGSIALGLLGVLSCLVAFIRGSFKILPICILGLVQASLAFHLFRSGNDFGLFKLAMFMQPALAGALTWLIFKSTRKRAFRFGLVGLYAALSLPTSYYYGSASLGLSSGGMTELKLASKLGISLNTQVPKPAKIISTLDNVVAAKFAAVDLRGYDLYFASRDFFAPAIRLDHSNPGYLLPLHPFFENLSKAPELIQSHFTRFMGDTMIWRTLYTYPRIKEDPDYYLISAPLLSLFNKFNRDPKEPITELFRLEQSKALRNFLFFVHSGRGHHYYLGDRRRIAIFQLEKDPLQREGSIAGMGRFMLLRMVNPDKRVYLRVSATRTFAMPRTSWSEKAMVHGQETYPLGLSGPGAFNKIIGPIRPLYHNGGYYLAIDFNETPKTGKDRRTGLMNLYSAEVPRDFRRLAGWGRDISALSEEEYSHLERPTRVSFLEDIIGEAKGLEYTGVFEDGWLSPHSTWVLGKAGPGDQLRLRFQVPKLDGHQTATSTLMLIINGKEAGRISINPGSFERVVPIPSPGTVTRVELAFSASGMLPDDDRVIGAQLESMEIIPGRSLDWEPGRPPSAELDIQGLDSDGWCASEIALTLPASAKAQRLKLDLEFPGWSKESSSQASVYLESNREQMYTLTPGQHSIEVIIPASENTLHTKLKLHFEKSFQMPAPDTRKASARLLRLKLEQKDSP
jgi:hypothetical protein